MMNPERMSVPFMVYEARYNLVSENNTQQKKTGE